MDKARARQYLEAFDYGSLFREELGWEEQRIRPFTLDNKGQTYTFHRVAHKREFQVLRLEGIPEHRVRVLLERQLNRMAAERLVIFEDRAGGRQLWEWVLNEKGKPLKLRTAEFRTGRNNELFLQKLEALTFTLAEEAEVTSLEAARRARRAFDVERVTKRFYEQFQKEHKAFHDLVSGLSDDARRWYTSLMLNRLMFVYFVQKKGFLDRNPDYLRDRLRKVQALKGKGKFHSFYRDFLLVLFHDGLGSQTRPADPELRALLGDIPYLNGGLFELHPLEAEHTHIHIPDEAFERVLAFFEQYQWHLDDRPLREGNEINPDVLGYIFEKYINQKEMGAYYTKEDITEYISKNTILPHLLETARQGCRVAFEGEGSLWKLLAQDPDRYIYEAVRRGAEVPEHQLPEFVQKGMHDPEARMFDKRYNLGEADLKDAEGNPLTLPTETWREYIVRRQRYHDLKAKLQSGEVQTVSDLITLNLNIRQFAQDVLDSAEGADLVRAFWKALTEIKILDPTCGSGAFLFAALNILQPLYESALDKMEALVAEADAGGNAQKYPDFRKVLAEVGKHPSERYYVLKSIVVNNLYGVDIMEEATEIAKLRLFLKLMSQVEHASQIEPLPDVDFNIRAGNALVGFATEAELDKALDAQLDLYGTKDALKEKLDDVEALSKLFRQQQTEHGGAVTPADKSKLRDKLRELEEELNRTLAAQYGIDPKKAQDYTQWKESHKPFHWFVDFYGIMKNGGFDAIIGNPPYLEFREVNYRIVGLKLFETAAIHAMCIERSVSIINKSGAISMIVPLSIVSTQRMRSVQELIEKLGMAWYANYAWRPAKLFDNVNRALTIFTVIVSQSKEIFSSGYQKWTSEERNILLQKLYYISNPKGKSDFWVPKLSSSIERVLLPKLVSKKKFATQVTDSGSRVYYRTTGGLYWKVFTNFPPKFSLNGEAGSSSRETWFCVANDDIAKISVAVLSSNTFWWWYTITSNLRDLNPSDLYGFPIPEKISSVNELLNLAQKYLNDLEANSIMLIRQQKQTGRAETQSFKVQKSKHIIDQIDCVLAQHYGFTPEELDFIINYDIKYRMGRDALDAEE